MVPDSLINLVADLEFKLQNMLFTEFGSIEPCYRGFRFKDGDVKSTHRLEVAGDLMSEYKTTVDYMLSMFPVVLVPMEVSETDQVSSALTEAVVINIHTKEKLWVLRCGIERSPSRKLIRGELS